MRKIDWISKLTSRKWWIALSAFIVSCIMLFGVDAGTSEKIGAIILLLADVVSYTLAEAHIDSARINAHVE